jgi:hypothetical protein
MCNSKPSSIAFYCSKTEAARVNSKGEAVERNLKGMSGLARLLVKLGLLLLLAGGLVYVLGRLGISFGHLPGDFAWRRKNVSVYFPLGTSIALSILLTLILYLLSRFRR